MVDVGKEGLNDPGAAIGRWAAELPWRERVLAASDRTGARVHLVGGALRDVLLARTPGDVDMAVEGDATALARELDPTARVHERFGTARVAIEGVALDLASARRETYASPGALPEVVPATIEADLDRRDFTINAVAAPLDDPAQLIDPHGGLSDLAAGRLEILHEASFRDDPTRALRAARYAARLGFGLSELAAARVREARLDTVSGDRVDAELALILGERVPVAALRLARDWGLLGGDLERVRDLIELSESPPWSGRIDPMPVALEAGEVRCGVVAREIPARSRSLAALVSARPSELAAVARGSTLPELAIALLLGAGWTTRYLEEWAAIRPAIGGADLIAAGIEPGPALGAGLDAALAARLDGEAETAERQLEVALAAARAAS